jgi:hypothetical protein
MICRYFEPEIVLVKMAQKRYEAIKNTKTGTEVTSKSPNEESKAIYGRANRAKYACKPELQKVIDWVNLVPPDHEMKPLEELVERKLLLRMDTPAYNEHQLRKAAALLTYLKTFPKELLAVEFMLEDFQKLFDLYQTSKEVYEQTSDPEAKAVRDEIEPLLLRTFQVQERRYWSLRTTRQTMYRLVEIGENPEPFLGQELKDIVIGVALLVEYAHLDKSGRIRRSSNPFAETLDGVEVSRIRACLVCRKLFWANRKDKRCCSEEHSRIIRQRQVRENQKLNKGIYGRTANQRKTTERQPHKE